MTKIKKFVDMIYRKNNISINENTNAFYNQIKELLNDIKEARCQRIAKDHSPIDKNLTLYPKTKIKKDQQAEAVLNFINTITDKLKVSSERDRVFGIIIKTETRKIGGFGYISLIEKIDLVEKNMALSIRNAKKNKENEQYMVTFKDKELGKLFGYLCDYHDLKYKPISKDFTAGNDSSEYHLDNFSFQKLSAMYPKQMKNKSSGCSIM